MGGDSVTDVKVDSPVKGDEVNDPVTPALSLVIVEHIRSRPAVVAHDSENPS